MKTPALILRFAILAGAALAIWALGVRRAEEAPAPVAKPWELWPKREKPGGDALIFNDRAMALLNEGKYAEAEAEYRTEMDSCMRLGGPDSSHTLRARTDLAMVLSVRGKHADAERELRSVMGIRRRVLGAEDQDTLWSERMLAEALRSQGKNAEAEKEYRTILEISEHALGAEADSALWSRKELAAVLDAQGKHSEAEKEYRVVLAVCDRLQIADESLVILTYFSLARCLEDQKNLGGALVFIQRAQEAWEKRVGPEHPNSKFAKQQRERIEAELKKQQAGRK